MSNLNYQHLVAKPLTVGAAAFAYTKFQTTSGVNDQLILFGHKFSLPLATAAAAAIGSLAAEIAHSVVFPHIEPVGKMWSSAASEAFAIGTSTAVQAGVLTLGNSGAVGALGLMHIATTSAIAEIAGSFVYDKFIAPMVFNQDAGYEN